ncbi:MAG: DUF3794 domain-containing protein [Clostridium sp.]
MNFICKNNLKYTENHNTIVQPNSILTFNFSIKYISSLLLKTCILRCIFPKELSILKETIIINGKNASRNINENLSITLDTFNFKEEKFISFNAIVNKTIDRNSFNSTILNAFYCVDYSYTNEDNTLISTTEESNKLNIKVSPINIDFIISADKDTCNAGEFIGYTIEAKNTMNLSYSDIRIHPVIPDYINILPNSVNLNFSKNLTPIVIHEENFLNSICIDSYVANVFTSDSNLTLNFIGISPSTLSLDSKIYSHAIITANTILDGKLFTLIKISPTVETLIKNKSSVNVSKEVTPSSATIDDILHYTIRVTNNSDLALNYVVLKDDLNLNLLFIPASVEINNEEKPFEDINVGINLNHILPHKSYIVKFKAKVIALPSSKFINNQASLCHEYTLDPSKPPIRDMIYSNPVSVIVEHTELLIKKTCTKTSINLYDKFSYKIILSNRGNVKCKDILLVDTLSDHLKIVENSLNISGDTTFNSDIVTGLQLEDLDSDKEVCIQFDAIYYKACYESSILDYAFASFTPDSQNNFERIYTDKVLTEFYPSNYICESFSLDNINLISTAPHIISELIDLSVDTEILSHYIVKTSELYFDNDSVFSVYKLIVHGLLDFTIQYVLSNDSDRKIHIHHIKIPFSKFLNIPDDYTSNSNILIELITDDIYYKLLNKSYLYSNIMLLMKATLSYK